MSERIRKPLRAGIIAAVVAFSVIAGTVGSYAYWSATAQRERSESAPPR